MTKKIVIIDDSNFQRKIIKGMLEELSYEVHDFSFAGDALEFLQSETPTIILCDLLMPKMDGFQFLEEWGKLGKKIPVIMLTSDKQESSIKRAMDLGAGLVAHKPQNKETLQTMIDQII